jgi:hypothetical protein
MATEKTKNPCAGSGLPADKLFTLFRSTTGLPDGPGPLMSYHTNGLKSAAIRQPSDTLLMGESGQSTRWDEAHLRPDQTGHSEYGPLSFPVTFRAGFFCNR